MRARQRLRTNGTEENFWPSFTDMISTIAIILFFLILIIFIKNIIVANDLTATITQLNDEQEKLNLLNQELDDRVAEISEKEENLMLLQDEAELLKLEVEQGQIALKLSEQQIVDQQKIIANSNLELGEMRTRINDIATIRLDILREVKNAMEAELDNTELAGVEDLLTFADNGNIIINNTLLFEFNSSTIGEDGQAVLTELANVFESVLSRHEVRKYIDAIQIEGHTDQEGEEEYNRDLSARRAISVVNYLLDEDTNDTLGVLYEQYFVASAYSETRPLEYAQSDAENRRIEISIILRDSSIQDIIDEYLEDTSEMLN